MNWREIIILALLGVSHGWAQQPQLEHRPEVVSQPAVPPPMKAPKILEPAHSPNTNQLYQALRTRAVNGDAFTVRNLVLRRDAGIFTLNRGTVYLYGPVAGRVTGAVFLGEGVLHVEPPSEMERRQLKAVMKTDVLDERFTSAVFAFTDDTAAELKKSAVDSVAVSGTAEGRAEETRTLFRHELKNNLEIRLLEDLQRPGNGGFFLAEMKGSLFSKRLIFEVDPHGAMGAAPEEVALLTSSDFGYDITLGFRAEAQRKMNQAAANDSFCIPQQTLDVTIEKDGKLAGTAVTAITAVESGLQVVPLRLFPSLRVSGVWGAGGEALDFIQEDRMKDANFAVLLKKPLAAGETVQITTSYVGKEAVIDEGNNNYYLVAREDWYPNTRRSFGNYASYNITFHTPKNVEVVATGNQISDKAEGRQRVSVWQSMVPIAVAGFNLGEFKKDASERNKNVQVVTYANEELAQRFSGLSGTPGMALGTMSTTGMLKRATSEGDAAIQIYTEYFGPLPYDHVSLTQQTACNYGQSWPMLVYLPICYFWDSTIQHQLGVLDRDPAYWQVVTAHEVAHQWWGQTVGFDSYRDQWMSEGFANFSASLFLINTRTDRKEERDFWTLMHKRLLEKNANGVRPVDVGPVVMGMRVNTSKTGENLYQALIYNKGAFILHSLEMLYWSNQYGDAPFKQAMHDLVSSYRNKPASTEDFKAVMERHMPPWLDVDRNHRLDWFFNAYVYGTALPKYTVTGEFTKKDDETEVHFKLSQSEVPSDFEMLVPLYLQSEDNRVILLGRAKMIGTTTVEQTVKVGKLSSAPKQLLVNYNFDLLAQ
jgi:peptidase M1-like protein